MTKPSVINMFQNTLKLLKIKLNLKALYITYRLDITTTLISLFICEC